MMKIAEMYRRSGGTHATEKCADCCNLEMIKNGKSKTYICSRYDGCTTGWWTTYPACAWFNKQDPAVKKSKSKDVPGQMSFMDFPGIMPREG